MTDWEACARTLTAERDTLRTERDKWISTWEEAVAAGKAMEAERDAALSELDKAREVLRKIAGTPTEDNEWDGRDKFRDCRTLACMALDRAALSPQKSEGEKA